VARCPLGCSIRHSPPPSIIRKAETFHRRHASSISVTTTAMATDWDAVVWHSENPERMALVMRSWEAHYAHPRLPRSMAYKLANAGFRARRVRACERAGRFLQYQPPSGRHLGKEISPAFGRHVKEPQRGSTRSPARWCCSGAGGAKLISESQKCLITPFFFLKTLKIVSSQFSPSGTRCCARIPLENFDVST
jgi:hypothetical protein